MSRDAWHRLADREAPESGNWVAARQDMARARRPGEAWRSREFRSGAAVPMMHLKALFRTLRKYLPCDEEGSALIEGAVVVPMLCVVLFGIYEFSWFFYQQHVISTGLRDAARYAARLPAACNPFSPEWPTGEVFAKNLATTGSINGGVARVAGWTSAAVRLDCRGIENPTEAG